MDGCSGAKEEEDHGLGGGNNWVRRGSTMAAVRKRSGAGNGSGEASTGSELERRREGGEKQSGQAVAFEIDGVDWAAGSGLGSMAVQR